MIAFPFWFIGPGIAGWAIFRLLRAVIREESTLGNLLFAVCGGMLALGGFSPLFMLVFR